MLILEAYIQENICKCLEIAIGYACSHIIVSHTAHSSAVDLLGEQVIRLGDVFRIADPLALVIFFKCIEFRR